MTFTARQPSVIEHNVTQWNADDVVTVLMTFVSRLSDILSNLEMEPRKEGNVLLGRCSSTENVAEITENEVYKRKS